MLSKLTPAISYMLCIGLLIHNYYLVIFTGKRTGQFFIDKSLSLTAINMYLLVRKVLYNGRTTPIFLLNNIPYLSTSNPSLSTITLTGYYMEPFKYQWKLENPER